MTKPDLYCDHCGAKMKDYWHPLNPGLVNYLVKIVKTVKAKGVNEINMQNDIPDLTKNEYTNTSKLKFHGFIEHLSAKDNKDGLWRVTPRASDFLNGKISTPYRVKTFRNKVIGHSERMAHVTDYINKMPWFDPKFDFEIHQKQNAQVQNASQPQIF